MHGITTGVYINTNRDVNFLLIRYQMKHNIMSTLVTLIENMDLRLNFTLEEVQLQCLDS